MAANDLVSAPIDTRHVLSGAGVFDSAYSLGLAISDGNWVDISLSAAGVALDTADAVANPVAALLSAGCGWFIDHIDPVKTWFDETTGNAPVVAGLAQSWANIANHVDGQAEYLDAVLADLYESGEWVEAYRDFELAMIDQTKAAGALAGALGTGLSYATLLVQIVHDLVRDALSDIVAKIIVWVAELALSLGFGTPVVVAQVATTVAKWAGRLSDKVVALLRSFRELRGLLTKASRLLRKVSKNADEALNSVRKATHEAGDVLGHSGLRHANKWSDKADDVESAVKSLRKDVKQGFRHAEAGLGNARHFVTELGDDFVKHEQKQIADWLSGAKDYGLSDDALDAISGAMHKATSGQLRDVFQATSSVTRHAISDGVFTPAVAEKIARLVAGKASDADIAGVIIGFLGLGKDVHDVQGSEEHRN